MLFFISRKAKSASIPSVSIQTGKHSHHEHSRNKTYTDVGSAGEMNVKKEESLAAIGSIGALGAFRAFRKVQEAKRSQLPTPGSEGVVRGGVYGGCGRCVTPATVRVGLQTSPWRWA